MLRRWLEAMQSRSTLAEVRAEHADLLVGHQLHVLAIEQLSRIG